MDDVYWINRESEPQLAIVPRPQGGIWLKHEMRKVRESGIDTVVSLLQPLEAQWLGLDEEAIMARKAGLHFVSFPIPDGQVPQKVTAFRRFVAGLVARLGRGEAVGVHCRGCIGRSTITAACVLIHLGWEPRLALEAIERARGVGVPDTDEQEEWILGYKPKP